MDIMSWIGNGGRSKQYSKLLKFQVATCISCFWGRLKFRSPYEQCCPQILFWFWCWKVRWNGCCCCCGCCCWGKKLNSAGQTLSTCFKSVKQSYFQTVEVTTSYNNCLQDKISKWHGKIGGLSGWRFFARICTVGEHFPSQIQVIFL